MADIAVRSYALHDDYGYGYRPSGSPTSPRYTVSKTVTDNGNGTGTVKLTVTIKMNNGYIYPQYILYLNLNVGGVTNQTTFKAQTASWYAGNSYSGSISVTIPLNGTTSRTANLWVTGTAGSSFTFASNAQGGDSITGIPVGYQTATFTKFSNFSTTASSIAVTIREKTASLTNRVTLKIGSTTIKTWTSVNDADSLALTSTEHTKLHNAIPNSTTATATMIMETLNGSTVIGSVTRTATATVSSTIQPTIASVSVTELNSAVSAVVGAGNYIFGLSNLRVNINTPKAGAGASIKSYTFSYTGPSAAAYNQTSGNTYTIGNVPVAGTYTIFGEIVDSRNRVASKSISIVILPYSTPSLTGVQYRRATGTGGTVSDNGTYLRVDRSVSVSGLAVSGTNKNSMTLKVETKPKTSSSWTQVYTYTWPVATTSNSGFTVPTTTYSIETSFDVRVTLTDKFTTVTASGVIGTAKFPMVLGLDNVGVGKVPTAGTTLDVGGKLNVDGNIETAGHINATKGMYVPDTRAVTVLPSNIPSKSLYAEFKQRTVAGNPPISATGTYSYILNLSGYNSNEGSGGWPLQISIGAGGFAIRQGTGTGTWGGWQEVFSSNNVQVLESTSGGFARCIRYPNGWQEIHWRRTLTTQVTLPNANVYYSNNTLSATNWPWAFNEQPTTQVTASGANQLAWGILHGTTTATVCPAIYVEKGGSDSVTRDYTINISAFGKWK